MIAFQNLSTSLDLSGMSLTKSEMMALWNIDV